MIKNLNNRRYKKRVNQFANGSFMNNTRSAVAENLSGANVASTANGMAGAALDIASTAMDLGKLKGKAEIEDNIEEQLSYQSNANTNDELMAEWSTLTPIDKVTYKDVLGRGAGDAVMGVLSSGVKGASAGAAAGPLGAAIGGSVGLLSSGISAIVARNKAKREAEKLNKKIEKANLTQLNTFQNKVDAVESNNDLNALSNYMAIGGNLEENTYNTIGINSVNSGGIHETNPNGGVPVGYDSQGTPNLVEEGEVIFDNYVFSNRLTPTKAMKQKNKYKGNTFADVAKNIQKESLERPNDPISKRGFKNSMDRLIENQEIIRQDTLSSNTTNNFAYGGGFPPLKIEYQEEDPSYWYGYNPTFDLVEEAPTPKPTPKPTTKKDVPRVSIPTKSTNTNSTNNLEGIKSNREAPIPPNPRLEKNYSDIPDLTIGKFPSPTTIYSNNTSKPWTSYLRYAPIVGSGLGVLSDVLGVTNTPDYTNAELIGNAADNLTEVRFNPLNNYLTYNPVDKSFYLNKLRSEAGATRRALVNQSGGNRAAATASLLAADYNAQGRIGDLMRNIEEYNNQQKERVATFNRGTDQYNREGIMKAAMANQRNDELRFRAKIAEAQMREQMDAAASAGRSANLTNFLDNLGMLGKEAYQRHIIDTNKAYPYNTKGEFKNANGGYLTIKKKRK